MKLLHDIRTPFEKSTEDVFFETRKKYGLSSDTEISVYRQSIDCRHGKLTKVYTLAIDTEQNFPEFSEMPTYTFAPEKINKDLKVVVVGMGPAGLFCAKTLTEYGICPTVIDRGLDVDRRVESVNKLWTTGILDENCNVQFGEGGAGTFSDGKLTCRKNDPRSRKILEDFVSYGAPETILTEALPHIGTDLLRRTVKNLREDLIKKGATFIYNATLYDFETDANGRIKAAVTTSGTFPCDALVLAVGNGSFDTFSFIMKKKIAVGTKPMSFGVRQEHLQRDVNRAIYGKYANNPALPAASYAFHTHLDKETCVYTFCMCPGGKVVNSSSLSGRLTVNGMSNYARSDENANSALLVSFTPESVDSAFEIQKTIEKRAFAAAGGKFPVSASFSNKSNESKIKPTVLPEYEFTDFSAVFPEKIISSLSRGSELFHKKIFGNCSFEPPIYTAPETRTSAPLRILRDKDTLRSLSCDNLYPCGEGAGYAGGIMSSAIDGMKIAEKIIHSS